MLMFLIVLSEFYYLWDAANIHLSHVIFYMIVLILTVICCFYVILHYLHFIVSFTVCCCLIFWPSNCNKSQRLLERSIKNSQEKTIFHGEFLTIHVQLRDNESDADAVIVTWHNWRVFHLVCVRPRLIHSEHHVLCTRTYDTVPNAHNALQRNIHLLNSLFIIHVHVMYTVNH